MLLETLSHIIPVVQANMAARLTSLQYKTGARHINDTDGGNRVVFVPASDTYEAGRQQPGVRRVIRVRVARVTTYLWGVPTRVDGTIYKRGEFIPPVSPSVGRDGLGQTEAMINALLCAIEDSAKQSASPGGGPQWDVDGEGAWRDVLGEGVAEYGHSYLITFSVRIPVVYDALVVNGTTPTMSVGYIESDGTTITTPPP